MSKKLDIGNLPSCRGNKRPKVDSSTPSTTLVVVLNPATPTISTQPPVVFKVDASLCRSNTEPSNPSRKAPHFDYGPLSLLRSENLAWSRFEQVVRNEDIFIGYDMSIKKFKHSTIHDLFKVTFLCPY